MPEKISAATDNSSPSKGGRPPKLSPEALAQLRALALGNPHATIDDLRILLEQQIGVQLCQLSMYRYLKRAGIRRKRSVPDGNSSHKRPPSRFVPKPASAYGYNDSHRDPGDATHYPGSLTDAEWALIADLFEHTGPGAPPRYPRRSLVDACCYVVRTGCSWRMLPKDFPPWQDVYAHFRRWTELNLFEAMHDRLREMWRRRQGRQPAPTAAILDSQSVKTSAQGGPKGYDAGKKVKGRKRHLVVDVLGILLAVLVLPADVQDRDGAQPVVQRAMDKYPTLQKMYVDGSYSGACAEQLRRRHKLEVEVVRKPASAGAWSDAQLPLFAPPPPPPPFVVLPRRWVVERTHSWVEKPRRLSKDYDRRLDVSASWIWLADTRLLLRRLTSAASG